MNRPKKNKKMMIALIIMISFLGLLILNKKVNIDRYSGIIKVSNVKVETEKVKKENTKKENEKSNSISSFNTLHYKINYRLDSDKNVKRDAIITLRINDEDKKYVVINEVNNETITSKKTSDGLEILVKNVETNYDHSLEIEVQINNAPNGYKFQPVIEVKEKTSDGVEIKPDTIEVKTTSLNGVVKDKNDTPTGNVLVEICLIDKDVCISKKQTYTDENGNYVFSNLEQGEYKVSVPEGYIVENDTVNVSDGSNELNIVYDQKGKFSASIKKYLEKIKVGDKEYQIDKKQIASIPMKGKNRVEASYLFEIENVSQSDGYIKTIRESLPDGFIMSNDELNKEWVKEGKYYINKSLSNEILKVGETKNIRIKIESEKEVDASLYKNKVEILGESYHTVKYILNDQLYKEYEIADGDKLDDYKIEQEGYNFSGWCTDKDYKNKFDFNKTIGKDTILYGTLIDTTLPKRKIIYMEDDTTVFDIRYIEYGECAEDIEGPAKEGYTFNYWKKDGEKYFNSEVCKPVIDEVTVLYSDFTPNEYDVNYYIPGTKNQNDNDYSYTGEYSLYEPFSGKIEYNTLINNPGKKDMLYYNFRGWYKENNLQNKVTYPYRITKDENFYGKYEIKKYNVEFYNSRSEIEPFYTETIDATTLFDEPENTPPEHYKIKEWQFEDESKVTFGDIAYNILEDRVTSEDDVIKIYRVLEADKYKIRYLDYTNELIDEDAEEILEYNQIPQKLDSYYNIVNTPNYREGYIFNGFSYKNKSISEYTFTYYSDLCETNNNCVIDLVATYIDKSTLPVSMIFIDKMGTTTIETPRGQVFDQTKIPEFTGMPGGQKYTPTGWYKVVSENGEPIYNNGYQSTGELFSFDTEIINETTYVIADYTPNKYILRFNKGENDVGEMQNQELVFTPSKWTPAQGTTPASLIDNINQNQFTRAGSEFVGWKSDITGNNIIPDQSLFNFLLFENDAHKVENQIGTWLLDLYPQFEELEYKVKYNANTGTGQMSDDIFTLSTAQGNTLKENAFTKTGYKFTGWSLESGDNKPIVYSNKESLETVINKMNELGIYTQTVYAQFEPINYTVTFVKEDDSVVGEMQDQNFVYDTPQNLNKNLYTKEGYEFKGWNYANSLYNDEQQVNNLTDVDNSILEFVTNFEIKKYKVIFMNENSEYEVQNNRTYGSTIVPPTVNPTYSSGIFKGWKLNGETDLFDFENRVINDDISEVINGERVIILVNVRKNIEPPIITTDPTEWTNDKVRITLNNNQNYDMKIKVGNNSYVSYTEPVYTSVNTEVRGKNIDGEDESAEVIKQIDNIDKINPSFSNYDSTSDSHSSVISIDTSDSDSGIDNVKLKVTIGSEEVTYCDYNTNKQTVSGRQTGPYSYNYSCSVDELTENTTYAGKIVITDVAGNVTEENIEFTTSDIEDIVARIISYDNVDIENPENYLNYSSLRAALTGCQNVSTTNKCTIQMVKNTTESNTINSDFDIKLDLNGKEITGVNSVTITNNGKLQVIDSNNTYEDETLTSYEPIGKIINNHSTTTNNEIVYDGTAIINGANATLIIGENEVADDEPGSIVSETEPYIEGSLRGVDASDSNSNFYFYDGVIKGNGTAIYGGVDGTPLLYDVNNVSEEGTQVATLKILSSAVARIKRTGTYFTNLDSARDAANNGAYVTEPIEMEGDLINFALPDQSYPYSMELATTQKGKLIDNTENNYDADLYDEFIVNEDNSINFNGVAYAELPTIFESPVTEETVQVKLLPQSAADVIYTGTKNENIVMVISNNYLYVSGKSFKYTLPDDYRDGNIKTITVVKNNDDYNYDVYIDNQKLSPAGNSLTTTYASTITNKAYIGSNSSRVAKSSMNFYELKIYNRALSESEINTGTTDGLLLNYDTTSQNSLVTEDVTILRNNNQQLGKNKKAVSYIKLDLTNYEDDQKLIVSAALSRYANVSNGAYAFVREASEDFGPDYLSTKTSFAGEPDLFIKLTKRTEKRDYEVLLEHGKIYYLYFAYEATNYLPDNFDVYSVRLRSIHRVDPTPCIHDEEIPVENAQYGFDYDKLTGSLVSNNKGVNSSSAYATFKLPDLTPGERQTFTINATVSSEYSDKALIIVNYSPTSLSGSYLLFDGGSSDYTDYTYTKDYTTTLLPNREYYLHLRYSKDSSTARGNDEFRINSIKINGQELMSQYVISQNYTNLAYYDEIPKLNTEFDIEDERYKDADTIELLKDIITDNTFNIEETRDVILDLKGHSLTSSNSNDYLISNNGKLTITDSSYKKSLENIITYNQQQQEQFNSDYAQKVEEYSAELSAINEANRGIYESTVATLNEDEVEYTLSDYPNNVYYQTHLDGKEGEKTSTLWTSVAPSSKDGVINGNPTWTLDNGLSLDGDGDYIEVDSYGSSKDYNVIFKTTELNKKQTLISMKNEEYGFGLYITDDNKIQLISTVKRETNLIETPFKIVNDTVYSVRVSKPNNANTYELYVNNEFVGTLTSTVVSSTYPTKTTFGADELNGNLSSYFTGVIYNIKVITSSNVSEEAYNQIFKVDSSRYNIYPSSIVNSNFGSVGNDSSNQNTSLLFDGSITNKFTTDNNELTITLSRNEENTIKSFKIYGTDETNKYPSKVTFEGSKDGVEYTNILTDENITAKSYGEYNKFTVENFDSYKYYRWKFNSNSGISISEIILESYDVKRIIKSTTGFEIENTSDNFRLVGSTTSKPSEQGEALSFSSGIYYVEKVTVDNYPITIDGVVMTQLYGGKIRVGFSNTINDDINDFVTYKDYNFYENSEKYGIGFNVTMTDPGEYYIKIITQKSGLSSSKPSYLYRLNINDSPKLTQISELESTIPGKVMISAYDGILNRANAQLVIDNSIISNNKVGLYNNYSSAIVNYGDVSLKNNAIINVNENYSNAIINYGYGNVVDSNGYINLNKSADVGVKNDSHTTEVEGITINSFDATTSTGYVSVGIDNSSMEDLVVENVNVIGYGKGIQTDSTNKLILNNVNLSSDIGVDSSGNVIFNTGTIDANEAGIKVADGSTLTVNGGYINGYTNGILAKGNVTINNGTISGYGSAIKIETKKKATVDVLGGTIKSHNIGINMFDDTNSDCTHNGELTIKNTIIDTVDTSIYVGSANSVKEIKNSNITSSNGYGVYYLKDSIISFYHTVDYENKPKLVIDNTNIKSAKSSIKLDTDDEISIIGNSKIISDAKAVESSKGTVNLGLNDGSANSEYPYLESKKETVYNYGIFNFYDGKLKGPMDKTLLNVNDTEDNYDINVNEISDNEEIVTLWIPTLNNDQSNAVAKIGNTKYASLKDAIANLDSELKTIEVIKNIKTIVPLTIENGDDGIINLGTHNIKNYSKDAFITNNGNIKLKSSNGLIYSSYASIVENNANSTFENVTMRINENKNYAIDNKGTMVADSGYILTCDKGDCNLYEGNDDSNVTFNSSYLSTNSGHAIVLNDNSQATINNGFYLAAFVTTISENATLTVNSGNITGAVAIDNYGNVSLNNSNIESQFISNDFAREHSFIKNRQGGYIELNGGTITPSVSIENNRIAVGDIENKGDFVINDGTINRSYIDQHGSLTFIKGYIYQSSMAIYSGEFVMGVKGDGITSISSPVFASTLDVTPITISTGAAFKMYDGVIKSRNVAGVIPTEVEDGYNAKLVDDKNNNGEFTAYRYKKYLTKYNVAKIGDDEYVTLSDAINSEHCESSACTIDLINNVNLSQNDEAIEIAANKNVTIKLNKKSIYSDNELLFNNLGTLNVKSTGNEDDRMLIKCRNLINNSGTASIELMYNSDKINSNYYIENTGILTLKNVDLLGFYNRSNGVINLSGETKVGGINYDNSIVRTLEDYVYLDGNFYLRDNSSAEINAGHITESIDGESENSRILVKNGTVNVKTHGELIVDPAANKTPIVNMTIYNEGHANIYGGKINSLTNSGLVNIGIKDGVYVENLIEINSLIENTGTINYYDGTIKSNNVLFNATKLPSDIENGYSMLITSDNEYKYVMKLDNGGVAQIGSTTYNTIQDAIDSSYCQNTYCEIKLLKGFITIDGNTPINVSSGKNIKLDLNGNLIETLNTTLINNAGTLEIFDDDEGVIVGETSKIINNTGTLTINMNGYYSSTRPSPTQNISIDNSGTMNITKLEINLDKSIYNNPEHLSGIRIIGINNSGILTTSENFEINATGSNVSGINSVMSSSTILNGSNVQSNVTSSDNSTLTINGGTISKIENNGNSTLGVNYGTIISIDNTGTSNINQENDKTTTINQIINNVDGTTNIYDGSVIGNVRSSAVDNSGTLNINGGIIRGEINSNIGLNALTNSGTANISGGSFYAETNVVIVNSGIMNVTGGEYFANSEETNTSIIYNTGTLDVSNTEINNADYGIELADRGVATVRDNSKISGTVSGIKFSTRSATLNLGDSTTPVSTTNPEVIGNSNGIDNRVNGTFNFYDGRVIGPSSNSIFGDVSPLEGYQVDKNPGTDTYEGYEISTLTTSTLIARAVSLNGVYYPTLQEAFDNTVDNSVNTMRLYVNINLEGNITVKDNTTVNIIKNGYEINKGYYGFVANDISTVKIYYDGDESNSLLATIRELLNIDHPVKVKKNIVVYNDDNGSKLSSAEEYTLLYNNNGEYEKIDVDENATPGKYTISTSRSDDKIHSYNGYITILNIPEGEYKLSGDNGTVSTFIVNEDGTLSGNVRTTYLDDVYNSNNLLASSEAKMILNIQTGKIIVKYEILITLIGIILTLFMVIRNKKINQMKED